MAKYRFHIVSPKGRKRKGKIEASDQQAAREMLVERGYSVLSLSPLLELVENDDDKKPKVERRARQGYRPTLYEAMISFEPDLEQGRRIMLWISLLGLLTGVAYSWQQRPLQPPPMERPELSRVAVRVAGKLVEPAGGWEGASLTFHFPQVPLDLQKPAGELVKENGEFVFDFEFNTQRPPTECGLTVRKRGFLPAEVKPAILTGQPLSVNFPPVKLKPKEGARADLRSRKEG